MNDHELDELLASMAPITDDEVASARLGPVAEAMRGAIMTGTHQGGDYGDAGARPSRRSRRTTRMVIVATTAAVLIGGTAAAAVLVEARTGTFGLGGDSEDGSGEFIRLDAAGAGKIVDELGSDIPLPPKGNFDRLKSTLLQAEPDGTGVQMTESGIVTALSHDAACQWTGYWLDGHEQGNEQQKAQAQSMLDRIPTWPAIVSSDGGGTVEQLRRRAEAARANEPASFMQDYQINCTGELSPTGN